MRVVVEGHGSKRLWNSESPRETSRAVEMSLKKNGDVFADYEHVSPIDQAGRPVNLRNDRNRLRRIVGDESRVIFPTEGVGVFRPTRLPAHRNVLPRLRRKPRIDPVHRSDTTKSDIHHGR